MPAAGRRVRVSVQTKLDDMAEIEATCVATDDPRLKEK